MRNKIKEFFSDYLKVGLSICNIMLLICMWFYPGEYDLFFWINFVSRLIFTPIAFFFGNKGIWIFYFVYTNIQALDMSYDNFTCIAVLSLLFAVLPNVNVRRAIAVTVLYFTDVIIVASLHHKSPYFIYAHLIGCAGYCMAMWKLKVIISNKTKLKLTSQERDILKQLADGCTQKEIEGYSESTIYRRLKEAKERNKFNDVNELIEQYRNENAQIV